ncbi:DHA2 family efflux MFS transporter permease subunit [Martelella lutilitoris]|uniref:DHA2 family efflux MFS transporter permease subunit n=1 Tax=Martelella lutilitoris TaxID=2583532 RepID=A0A5C4JUP8_9HYPH|nr:DHA2 family efflux MFS transporter permease subunit [Martelella lutilitoris]TNB49138.1 DHA2 family efflux MFS transporter permease subunit [Martelella lutilitoris]
MTETAQSRDQSENASAAPAGVPSDHVSARTWAAFVVMAFGMFMAILDIQIVASALTDIQAGISASADEIAWVQTSYLIAEVIMIPLSGILARIFSTRVVFSVSAAAFTACSALCATATSIDQMIIYRALQGFMSGGLVPAVFAVAFTAFPPSKRSTVIPVVGLVATMAPTIGPTVGGYLVDAFSWHWLFLINVVPGILVTIGAWLLIDFDRPDYSIMKHFDWIGLVAMALFLGSLEYFLEEGNIEGWFQAEVIRYAFVVMIVAGVAFFYRSFTSRYPVVELRAFGNFNFAVGSIFSFSLGIGLYGLVYLFPLYMARIRGYDALMIGETMFVTGAFMMATAPVAGILQNKLDPRVMMGAGLGLFALCTWQMTHITAEWDYWELFWPQAGRGVALMISMIPVSNIALGTLPPQDVKNASGLFNLTRNLGGAVGLAIINTLLSRRDDFHYDRLAASVDAASRTTQEWVGTLQGLYSSHGLDGEKAALLQLGQMVSQQAWLLAFIDVFVLLTALFAFLTLCSFLVRKPMDGAGGGAGH